MVRILLEIDDIDYNSILEKFLPQVAETMRKSNIPAASLVEGGISETVLKFILSSLSQERKDELLVQLINSNGSRMEKRVEDMAKNAGISFKVTDMHAETASRTNK